jgi:hypothetical protein
MIKSPNNRRSDQSATELCNNRGSRLLVHNAFAQSLSGFTVFVPGRSRIRGADCEGRRAAGHVSVVSRVVAVSLLLLVRAPLFVVDDLLHEELGGLIYVGPLCRKNE